MKTMEDAFKLATSDHGPAGNAESSSSKYEAITIEAANLAIPWIHQMVEAIDALNASIKDKALRRDMIKYESLLTAFMAGLITGIEMEKQD